MDTRAPCGVAPLLIPMGFLLALVSSGYLPTHTYPTHGFPAYVIHRRPAWSAKLRQYPVCRSVDIAYSAARDPPSAIDEAMPDFDSSISKQRPGVTNAKKLRRPQC